MQGAPPPTERAAAAPVHGAHVWLAGELRRRGQRVTALVAAGPEVDAARVAFSLAVAFARITGAPTACIASDWPLLGDAHRTPPDRSELGDCETFCVSEAVILIRLQPPVPAGDAPDRLAAIADTARARFGHVLLDLTGLRCGERAGAASIADGVVAIARAGKTRVRALSRLRRELSPAPFAVALVEG